MCAEFERESLELDALINQVEEELGDVSRRHLARLKQMASKVGRLEASLASAVEQSPELFQKPKTMVISGVKVGFRASAGRVVWDDEEAVVRAIRKVWKEDSDLMLSTVVSPRKEALKNLTPVELEKLGCRIEDDGDQVVCARANSDVKKLLDAVLKKLVEQMLEV